MTREELIKAAEEYFKSKNPNSFETTPILISAFAEFAADFHLHQTKKMLEDAQEKLIDRAEEFMVINRASEYDQRDVFRAQSILRNRQLVIDELSKQLEG